MVLGNCTGPGGDVARVATLTAGLPVDVPALTVDRQCGSGLAAVEVAAAMVAVRPGAGAGRRGRVRVDRALALPAPGRRADPVRYERAPFAPAALGDPEMGVAADQLAARCGVTRERQDAYAARSHARAAAARDAGGFDAEMVPVGGALTVTSGSAPGSDRERLARLRPAFARGGTVTAGNSCGDQRRRRRRSRSWTPAPRPTSDCPACACWPPPRPGWTRAGPGSAWCRRSGPRWTGRALALGDLDVVELNEAFAGQVLACCDALGLDEERVCPEGGALALGHPWGASGAVLAVRLFSRLVRRRAAASSDSPRSRSAAARASRWWCSDAADRGRRASATPTRPGRLSAQVLSRRQR